MKKGGKLAQKVLNALTRTGNDDLDSVFASLGIKLRIFLEIDQLK